MKNPDFPEIPEIPKIPEIPEVPEVPEVPVSRRYVPQKGRFSMKPILARVREDGPPPVGGYVGYYRACQGRFQVGFATISTICNFVRGHFQRHSIVPGRNLPSRNIARQLQYSRPNRFHGAM